MMKRIVILGAAGMLGSMLIEQFASSNAFQVVGCVRTAEDAARLKATQPSVQWRHLDVETCNDELLVELLDGACFAINAVGLIKQRIVDTDDAVVERAVRVNALFAYALARAADRVGCRVLQVATDCVYSGATGRYGEGAAHDCRDVYGKTKSLGEVQAAGVHNLRCSIIGPERATGLSLLNWFLTRPQGATISGFTNHLWNGVTTLHFAKICIALAESKATLANRQHVVPSDCVTKDELLRLFAVAFKRSDVNIISVAAEQAIDRTLVTENSDCNAQLWRAAGYASVPTISQMVVELAEWQLATERSKRWGK